MVERGHHLTLWSRFGPYDRAAVDRIAYRRRLLFEYWAHAACLVPASHYPAWRRAMLDYSVRNRAWGAWLKKNRRVLRAVEDAIADGGPLGSADFEHRRAPGSAGGWWNWKPAAHALDYLWMSGRTLVHSRSHFRKRFDLAERVMPAAAAQSPCRARRSAAGTCAGRSTRWAPRARPTCGCTSPSRASRPPRGDGPACRPRAGEIVEVAVEGERGPWLALAEDLPALAAAGRKRRPAAGTTLALALRLVPLAPRAHPDACSASTTASRSTPPGHQRVHGYYSLPIFHDGQLIGRLDPKTHRAERGGSRSEARPLRALVREGGRAARGLVGTGRPGAALAGVGEALRSLATFVGAEDVTLGRVTPAALAPALRRAVKG